MIFWFYLKTIIRINVPAIKGINEGEHAQEITLYSIVSRISPRDFIRRTFSDPLSSRSKKKKEKKFATKHKKTGLYYYYKR